MGSNTNVKPTRKIWPWRNSASLLVWWGTASHPWWHIANKLKYDGVIQLKSLLSLRRNTQTCDLCCCWLHSCCCSLPLPFAEATGWWPGWRWLRCSPQKMGPCGFQRDYLVSVSDKIVQFLLMKANTKTFLISTETLSNIITAQFFCQAFVKQIAVM